MQSEIAMNVLVKLLPQRNHCNKKKTIVLKVSRKNKKQIGSQCDTQEP